MGAARGHGGSVQRASDRFGLLHAKPRPRYGVFAPVYALHDRDRTHTRFDTLVAGDGEGAAMEGFGPSFAEELEELASEIETPAPAEAEKSESESS